MKVKIVTSNREKLQKELSYLEEQLKWVKENPLCDCPCHEEGSRIMHIVACCAGPTYKKDILDLEQKVNELKTKLRILPIGEMEIKL